MNLLRNTLNNMRTKCMPILSNKRLMYTFIPLTFTSIVSTNFLICHCDSYKINSYDDISSMYNSSNYTNFSKCFTLKELVLLYDKFNCINIIEPSTIIINKIEDFKKLDIDTRYIILRFYNDSDINVIKIKLLSYPCDDKIKNFFDNHNNSPFSNIKEYNKLSNSAKIFLEREYNPSNSDPEQINKIINSLNNIICYYRNNKEWYRDVYSYIIPMEELRDYLYKCCSKS